MAITSATTDRSGGPRLGQKRPLARKAIGRMGPWQLVRVLGEGAMTRVYLARPAEHEDAQPTYAVKSLKREWWSEPAAIAAQRREAWIGGRVSHPNLAPVLASAVTAPPFYLVTPRLGGQTAEAMLGTGVKPALPVALWIARQAAQALEALLTGAGVIHSDVKPGNLMVGPDGHTTLLDLGFCQTAHEARSWVDRPVVGTLRYLAPERVTSATTIDTRSDLYSLGATLYELIAGRPPFAGETPAALIAQHREARPACLHEAVPGTPKRVASLVHRLLAKDPLRRPSAPAEVIDELMRLEIECFGVR
ncbi:serine/threonine-protein kinase [Botrimarina hoheduenensis]|uniref:Serine/threonine-protein kinase PknB n=1 Tax=Botrimarina hoheduenensis TaxID=2528000 RepID=A0A5C5VZ01_9BACT|nr:serine/threonine-protein kinase [Botrimarina hoheduenensis]TWT43317.1 Serine/threonine-protein kinase PknB [Botrimarina hoheduenensis]